MVEGLILQYEIIEKLGEGGMGEVYKAKDTKLDRYVALKFLPSQLTATEEEKARFIQEAKTASSMNHPNVCTIYDIQELDGQLFIVMEYIEGKTLKDKVGSLSEKQKLEIGIQAAEGLAAAHEKGIVHRDIKPENIMIRKDGIVQIMDFGLAKLYTTSNVSRLTKAGTTMGTMGYMSPEQVQGLDVDHRTDIFSLGIVLYEMFAGEPPFKGIHETAIMYEIVNVDPPPISAVIEGIDPELDEIILECLEKDKDERYQSAKELAKDLRKIKKSTGHSKSRVYNVKANTYVTGSMTEMSDSNRAANTSGRVKLLKSGIFKFAITGWVVALVLLTFAVFMILKGNVEIDNGITSRFSINLAEDESLNIGNFPEIAISRDGSKIVYGANNKLYLRNINDLNATPLQGTEDALTPFFSPDGNWIGFFNHNNLYKIPVNGGAAIPITDVLNNRGGSWGSDGTIIFQRTTDAGLFKISDTGGDFKLITVPDSLKNERTHRWPQYISEFNTVIYTIGTFDSPDYYEDSKIEAMNLKTGEKKTIVRGASTARYLKNGYLVYTSSGVLYAAKFDIQNLSMISQPYPVIHDISGDVTSGSMNYSISNNGTLVYFPGQAEQGDRIFVELNDKGEETSLQAPMHTYIEPRISPDGKKLATVIPNGRDYDIWIYDITKNSLSRLTFGGNNRTPTWSPDGKKIAYWKYLNSGKSSIYTRLADGSDDPKEVFSSTERTYVDCWSPDSKYLVLDVSSTGVASKLKVLELNGDKNLRTFVISNSGTRIADLSPDGKWLAYTSNESGDNEVYVKEFPDGEGKWQVSNGDGVEPHWAPDGKSIYFISGSKMMKVSVSTAPTFSAQIPVILFSGYFRLSVDSGLTYDVSPDGKYFITTKADKTESLRRITVVLNWFDELNKLTSDKNVD